MKKLTIVFLLLLSLSVNAQWVQTNGPKDGPYFSNIYSFDNILYAISYNRIYISSDSGKSWIVGGRGLPSNNVTSLYKYGSKLFVTSSTIYASDDNGINWNYSGDNVWGTVTSIASNSQYLFAASGDYGLYYSTDLGITWIRAVNNGIKKDQWGRIPITALATKDNKIYAGTWYSEGIYVSTNNGDDWSLINNGLKGNNISSLFINGQNLYIGIEGNGIFTSSNNGVNWSNISNNLPTFSDGTAPNINAISAFKNKIYASITCFEGNYIYSSSDNGKSWINNSNGVSGFLNPSALQSFASSNDIFFLSGSSGLFRLSSDASSWNNLSDNFPPSTGIYDLLTLKNNLIARISDKLFYSSNSGNQWKEISLPKPNSTLSFVGALDSLLIINLNGLYSTADLGNSWTYLNQMPIRTYISEGKILTMYGYHTLNVSSDFGVTWNTINPVTGNYNDFLTSVDVYDNTIFCGVEGKGLVFSSDNGITWGKKPTGFPNDGQVIKIVKKGSQLFAATWNKGVFVSNDSGFTWYEANAGLENSKCVNSINVINNKLFAAVSNNSWNYKGKIVYSSNNGYSWLDVNNGFNSESVNYLASDRTNIYAGTGGNGVWKRPISEIITDIEKKDKVLPARFSLSQNYPNPFNPSTTIDYQLSTPGLVTLKVFDLLGREVATLVDEYKSAGVYNSQFSIRNFQLNSGVYFYRLQAGSYSETKKLILMK